RQERAEVLPQLRRRASDRADLGHVVAVAVALAVRSAPFRPNDEEHDDKDRERDERDETEERGQIPGSPEARSGATRASTARGAGTVLGRLLPGRRLLLVEEVE